MSTITRKDDGKTFLTTNRSLNNLGRPGLDELVPSRYAGRRD